MPDFGMGLMDYATAANIEQWLREKVLLAPNVSKCAIPKGIFSKAEGAMLRMIAYGPELNLTHPPRTADVKATWSPEWAVRVRTKSAAFVPLGVAQSASERGAPTSGESKKEEGKKPGALDVLGGIFGR